MSDTCIEGRNEVCEIDGEWTVVRSTNLSNESHLSDKSYEKVIDEIDYPKHRLVAIILGGLPGSGKTTVRKAIIDRIVKVNEESEEKGFIEYDVVSTDDYIEEKAEKIGVGYEGAYELFRKNLSEVFTNRKLSVLKRAKSLSANHLVRQYIVIFDLTNIQSVYRSYIKELNNVGFTVVGVFFSSVIKNTKVPKQAFERLKTTLQPPTLSEGFSKLYVKKTIPERSIKSIATDLEEFCPDLVISS